MVVQPGQAAAVMLLRDSEVGLHVFMVRRSVKSAFMPDVYVFPGGSVSAVDRTVEAECDLCRGVPEMVADPEGRTLLGSGIRAAAIRELFEEANILFACTADQRLLALSELSMERFAEYRRAFNARQGDFVAMLRNEQLVLATDLLMYFSHWITPERSPRRFDTHFFLAPAPSEQKAMFDAFETSDGVWIQPGEALQRFEHGTFPLAFPTIHQLRDLATFADVSAALSLAARRYVITRRPVIIDVDGREEILLPDDSSLS